MDNKRLGEISLKKLILIFTFFFIGLNVQAADNFLHTIVLEGTDDGYNIVLKADSLPEVKKTAKGADNLVLDVKGITTSRAVNAIYKSTTDVNGLVIENVANDELKVYIHAKGIAKATVMAQTKTDGPVILSERFPLEKVLWSVAVLVILFMLIKSARAITAYENSLVIKKDIKDREIELYRNFQRELASMPAINCKINNAYATNVMPRSRRNYKELARM